MATKVFTYSPQIWKTWRSMCQLDLPSGKLSHNELERSTIFNGKTHYYRTAGPGELGTVDGERQRWHQWGHHPFLQAVVLSTLADGVQGWMASLSILSSTRMADSQCQKKMGSFGFIWDDILLFLRLGCGFQPAKIGFQAQTCHFQQTKLGSGKDYMPSLAAKCEMPKIGFDHGGIPSGSLKPVEENSPFLWFIWIRSSMIGHS